MTEDRKDATNEKDKAVMNFMQETAKRIAAIEKAILILDERIRNLQKGLGIPW